MTVPTVLAAELGLLTQALDLPGTDIAQTLTRLVADVRVAVDTYLGLSVVVGINRSEFDLTVLAEGARPEHVRTSLLIPLSLEPHTIPARASIALILYAATPGAFIDLAVDLSLITGRTPTDYRLDEHCAVPASHTDLRPLGSMSTVDQALGVLIGRGSTLEEAERELHARAAAAGIEPAAAATVILADLQAPLPERQRP